MSALVAIAFKDEKSAFELREKLVSMQKEYLIDLEDAVVVTKNADGKVKLHQAVNLTAAGAVSGSFWGMLIGMLFLNPILGAAVGAGAGALSGALSDIGINDNFMKELGSSIAQGGSVLFVLVRSATTDKVLEGIKGFGGTVLKTSLTKDQEDQLREVLAAPGVKEEMEQAQTVSLDKPATDNTSTPATFTP
ncbi:MAG: DUF1269 domain-containing protein [Thiofilum sp.]|uniref:DUF1269 domain-containing protein n=1 Tax=Thiofilum sp. TaxID=2212733 RepID=UPI0025CD56E0|nr:DUF1269 domain-containing protein [Thiofilum sp.]MBK8454242.1 DUF1269 domain-containing protein [Thiofilum sp.]